MTSFQITVINKRSNSVPSNVHDELWFMLFQRSPNMNVQSWSTSWVNGKITAPGRVGPIELPEEVGFAVIDTDPTSGLTRVTGPYPTTFGDNYTVSMPLDDGSPPTVSKSEVSNPSGEVTVTNASGNSKPLEFALFKNDRKLLCQKDVIPNNTVFLAVEPQLYIAQVEPGSYKVGTDFRVVTESTRATPIVLNARNPHVTIMATELGTGEITFTQT